MDEQTTTEAVTQDTGVVETQPEEQQAEAVQQADHSELETNDQDSYSEETSTDGVTSEQDVWAKKGIDITTPEGQAKAAKMYADAQKALTQKAQKASELEKQLSAPVNGVEDDRVARLEVIMQTRDFFDRNPEARALEKDMAEYINADPLKRELIKAGYLSLDEVHAIVASNPNRTSELKSEGRQEGYRELAVKQRATAVSGNATNSAPAPKVTSANADEWWSNLSAAERRNPANIAQLDSLLK